MLENQVGGQDCTAKLLWGIQIGKLVTQQIGVELQLQEDEFNITIILCPKYHIERTLQGDLANGDLTSYI